MFGTQKELKEHYARLLRAQGYGVSMDVAVGEHSETIDILSSHEIITCKLTLDSLSATEARSQLDFYGRYSPRLQKVVVVEQIVDEVAAQRLKEAGINLVTIEAPVSIKTAQQLPKISSGPAFQYSSTHDYKAFEGGKGNVTALYAIAFIFVLGLFGFMVSVQQQQQPSNDSSRLLTPYFFSNASATGLALGSTSPGRCVRKATLSRYDQSRWPVEIG